MAHTILAKYEPLEATDADEVGDQLKAFWKKTSHTETSTGSLGDRFASAAGTLVGLFTYESELPKIVNGMASQGGVKVYYPDPGIMNDHPAWIPERAPNPEAAQTVLAYMLSQDGQNQMARYTHLRPINPKATIEFPPEVQPLILWEPPSRPVRLQGILNTTPMK